MPNPTQISLLNYHFEAAACDAVLTVMLNKSDRDYSTPDELNHATELTQFSYEDIRDALSELHRRGFLLQVKKPYGYVYAVNKLRISNMEFVYGTYAEVREMGNTREKKTIADEVCRVHRSGGYAVLSNCFVRSVRIGCDAIGLLAKIMDLPSKWNFTIKGLAAICKDGETAIRSQLAELEEWGYAKKVLQLPNENPTGQFRYVYDFYEYSEMDDSIPKYDIEMETFTADNATLNRVKKDSNFTMVSGKILRTTEIRNKLIGFMLKVLSLPNSWQFSMPGLTAICKEGKTAVYNAVNKLRDMGYLVRTKLLSNESIHNCFEYVYRSIDGRSP